jgi:hypothetical protein
MRFRVFHRTRYVYRAPVRDSYNEAAPAPGHGRQVTPRVFPAENRSSCPASALPGQLVQLCAFLRAAGAAHGAWSSTSQSTIHTTIAVCYQDGKPLGVNSFFGALTRAGATWTCCIFLVREQATWMSSPEVWRLGIDAFATNARMTSSRCAKSIMRLREYELGVSTRRIHHQLPPPT